MAVESLKRVLESVPIYGFQGTTLIDFPKKISSIIFTGFCNLRCPYCHNKELVDVTDNLVRIPHEFLYNELKKRKKFNNGVVITGGEPLLFEATYDLIKFIKDEFDYKVKLDTNGTRFDLLKKIVEDDLIDYVAMDVKTVPKKYDLLGVKDESDIKNILQSIDYIKSLKKIEKEFRITLHPDILSLDDLDEYSKLISGDTPLYIQLFRNGTTLDPSWSQKESVSVQLAEEYKDVLKDKNIVYIRN